MRLISSGKAYVCSLTPEQARENAGSMSFALTDTEWEQIDRVWRNLARQMPKYRIRRLKKFIRYNWRTRFGRSL